MRIFAIIVFALHALAEMGFGLNAFLSGAFSSQPAEEVATQPAHLASSARFLGAALFSLGLLGAVTVIVPGVASAMGRLVAAVLFAFHAIGVAGVFVTASAHPGFLSQTHAQGALTVHLVLALGFLGVLLVHGRLSGADS